MFYRYTQITKTSYLFKLMEYLSDLIFNTAGGGSDAAFHLAAHNNLFNRCFGTYYKIVQIV